MLRNVRRPRNHLAPNFNNTNAIRDRLLLEIADLHVKLDGVDVTQSQENLSTMQSFKEMIHSREQMLGNLSRQKSERSSFGLEKPLQ
ncbi:MAG TPA: hypothetical protein DCL66_07270 [Gammaproteobacteria bacterium]|nr:hypothetical protein [Gammaproteobacteria bacterium]|tara:strand:+ start:211 stop:471 length:261 start_codon:yes stop_codon:yes gene_type:complete